MKFEFYVLNHSFNQDKIYTFNIFDNYRVNTDTEKEIRKYLRGPAKYSFVPYFFDEKTEVLHGFEALCAKFDVILHEEWSRCEYEIMVCGLFSKENKWEKWDCYAQAKPNIPIIMRECIYQYKKQKKEEKTNED